MKKLLFILLLPFIAGCDEGDDPSKTEFRIEDQGHMKNPPYLSSRFENFLELADAKEVTVPKDNMILRWVWTDSTLHKYNDSKAYKQGNQLYIDIDEAFFFFHVDTEDEVELILFQQFANGLLGTPFRDCGFMRRVQIIDDLQFAQNWDAGDYPVLFDPSAPCNDD